MIPPHHAVNRSIRRSLLAAALTLSLLVLAAAAFVSSTLPGAVGKSAHQEVEALVETHVRREASSAAARAAGHAGTLLESQRQLTVLLAAAASANPGAAAGAHESDPSPGGPQPADAPTGTLDPWWNRFAPTARSLLSGAMVGSSVEIRIAGVGRIVLPAGDSRSAELSSSAEDPDTAPHGAAPGRWSLEPSAAGDEGWDLVHPVALEPNAFGRPGWVAIRLPLDAVADALRPSHASNEDGIAVVDENGAVLAAAARIGDASTDDGHDRVWVEQVVGDALEGEDYFHPPASGVLVHVSPHVVSAAQIPGTEWTAVIAGSRERMHDAALVATARTERAARESSALVLALGIVTSLLVALAGAWLARHLGARLVPLVEGVDAHASGDLAHQIEMDGNDEFAALAVGLNRTAVRLRNNLARSEESERRLHALIEHMGEGFVIAGADDRILFVNMKLAEMLNREREDLQGRSVEELLVPASVEAYAFHIRERREGRTSRYEVEWLVRKGDPIRTMVAAMPLYDEGGEICGSYGVVTDITHRARVQEESARAEKLRALGEMAGGVAHDFNNVLTVVLGNAQYLMLDEQDENVLQALRTIEQAALDGTQTVRRIREFTKPRSLDARATAVDPNQIVADIVEQARTRLDFTARREGVVFEVILQRQARRLLRANAAELREAMLNLVFNALEAMPDGGRLRVSAFDRGEDEIALRVEDTGCGMDEDVQRNIFDPFFSTKEGDRCSGLGLSITYGIVRGHGGSIRVRSVPGSGTTFTILLPAWRRQAADGDVATGEPSAPPTPRVLYLAGEVARMGRIERTVRELGMDITGIRAPAAAVSALAEASFNLLLVDHQLEGATGWDVCRQVRAAGISVRIVLLAEPHHQVDDAQARNTGIDRVLVSPFDARDVEGVVLSVLGEATALRFGPQGTAPPHATKAEQTATCQIWTAKGVREADRMGEETLALFADSVDERIPSLQPVSETDDDHHDLLDEAAPARPPIQPTGPRDPRPVRRPPHEVRP